MNQSSIETKAMVAENQPINDRTTILTLHVPGIAETAVPGQFVNLSCNHFLRRPIGIMGRNKSEGTIQVGIRIQGEGTAWLSGQKPGDEISCLGPLGHGFDLAGLRRVITVGGGTGVFPLFFVQQVCREAGIEGLAVCGYPSMAESILVDEYADMSCRCLFASDMGDMDVPGHAVNALEQLLHLEPPVFRTAVMTCGPRVMMAGVARVAREYGLPCQVSLEERMACGVGVCLVCACKIKEPGRDPGFAYQRCCSDGPVFPAEVVEWST